MEHSRENQPRSAPRRDDGRGSEADALLTARQAAAEAGVSVPSWWRGVAAGRLPNPVYPAERAPRWRRSEIHAALEATRMSPREAKRRRREARLQAPKERP